MSPVDRTGLPVQARGANWNRYDLGNGNGILECRPGANYESAPGTFSPCNPGWTDEDGETVASRATQFPVEFKRTGGAVRLYDADSGVWTRIEPQGVSLPTYDQTSERILLGGLWTNTDLEVHATETTLKVWYVLTAAGHPTDFEWEVFPHPSAGDPVSNPDGTVTVGGITFRAPWLLADDGEYRGGSLSWRQQGNRTFLTVGMPDVTGLSYPIRVDPTTSFGAANDGFIGRQWLSGQIWSEIRNWNCNVNVQGLNWCHIQYNGSNFDDWIRIRRVVLPFDTSGLPDVSWVQSADLEVYPETVYTEMIATHELILLGYTGAVPPTTADCDNIGSTEFGSADYSAASPGVKFTIALNAAGLASISKTGNTDLALRQWHDFNDVEPPRQPTSHIDGLFFSESGGGGTYAGPALVITYTTDPPVEITTTTLPDGYQGLAYSQQLQATGGDTGTYTWSLASGTLPDGLNLSTGGLISGTPTATGTWNFTVQVDDGTTDTQALTLEIVVPPVTGESFGLRIAQAVEAALLKASVTIPTGVKTPPAGLTVERERIGVVTYREVENGPHIVVTVNAEPKVDRDHWKSPMTVRYLELLVGIYVLANDVKGADALDPAYVWAIQALQSDRSLGGLSNWISEESSELSYTRFPESGDLIAGREVKVWVNYHTRTDRPEARSN